METALDIPQCTSGAAPRGRPREFCTDQALAAALGVFWAKGYEGASMADLTAAMGITKPSLYAAFGNKEALFRQALDLYEKDKLAYIGEAIEAPTARAVAENLLFGAVDVATQGAARGCMGVIASVGCQSVEPSIRDDVNELIDRFIDRGECEFISEFGALLPGWAFFKNVLGLPVDDLAQLVEGVEEGTFNPDMNERGRHFANVFAYLEDHLRWRSEQPEREDLIGTILKGVTYDDGEPAPWEHKVSILVDLTFGGIATTTFVMASAIHHLATHPDQRQLLIDDPSLIENAIEEYARFFPPVVALGRTCTRDVEIAGTEIPAGEFVMLTYAAASRDPRHMDDPGKIDLTRQGIPHSTFGVGRHRCIGSNLARVELSTTLEEWLKRIPEFSVKPGTEPVYVTGYLRSMRKLELVW